MWYAVAIRVSTERKDGFFLMYGGYSILFALLT